MLIGLKIEDFSLGKLLNNKKKHTQIKNSYCCWYHKMTKNKRSY